MKDQREQSVYRSRRAVYQIQRPRLDEMFDQATQRKLVYLIAGAGYGKTQAMHQYIEQQQDAVVRWMQLTEVDNISSRYWENLTHTISMDNPKLATKLRELGFPETIARFKQFAEIIRSTEHRSHKTFLVLDDFHLIHSKQMLIFTERCAHLQIPGACVIIISRKQPDINIVSLFSKGKVSIVTEDELRFTVAEATAFFRQLAISLSTRDIVRLLDVTKGWALAINICSLVLKRIPNNLQYALNAMRQNIFKLMEIEAWNDFSEDVQKTIVKVSLLSKLPVMLFQEITDNLTFLQNTPELSSFIWFHSFANDVLIHPLYLEFLESKRHILSQGEKQDTYRRAARWCSENNFHMDTMYYWAKSYQFERMVQTLLSYPFKLHRDTSEYFLNILKKLDPDHEKCDNDHVLFLKNYFIPLLLIGAGRYEEAWEQSLAVVREWERVDTPLAMVLLFTTYSTLAYIDMYISTSSHRYDSPKYLKKSVEYFKRSALPPGEVTGTFINADIRSFVCLVGEGADLSEFDRFLEAARQAALCTAELPYNIYAGYDELVACEYAFFKNQPALARDHAYSAILKAREKKQYSIVAMAEQYLLSIALQLGHISLVKKLLKQLHTHLDNPNFWNRQLYYDLYTGLFYAQIGCHELTPQWFVMDEKEAESEIRIPTRELLVSAWYYIASKKYHQALTVLCDSYPREPQERFLFGELRFSLLTAVARIQTGNAARAMAELKKAYELSFYGVFEMPFIELGKELSPLVAEALKRMDSDIPAEWLKKVDRKAAIYAKKVAVVANALQNRVNSKESGSLSARELEILNDLYHGLSREGIAENRHLSINTVKKILLSIYTKLDVHNKVDAIRIALERKLID